METSGSSMDDKQKMHVELGAPQGSVMGLLKMAVLTQRNQDRMCIFTPLLLVLQLTKLG